MGMEFSSSSMVVGQFNIKGVLALKSENDAQSAELKTSCPVLTT